MSRIATTIIAKVEAVRLQKAVEGLVSGGYVVTVALQSETEIRGFVANGDGKEYGVVLSQEQAFCSCRDFIFRKGLCKHAVLLALYVIRTPSTAETLTARKEESTEQPVNLKLGKVRQGFSFSA